MSLIAVSNQDEQVPLWQHELQNSSQTVQQLLKSLNLDQATLEQHIAGSSEVESDIDSAADTEEFLAAAAKWPLRVPQGFVERMQPENPLDPLLLQVLPQASELRQVQGYVPDPVGEFEKSPHNGLIQKYQGRALLMLTGACAVHCRYCFRREFDYAAHRINRKQWQNLFAQLAADTSLSELIMSGGDPLMHNNDSLAWFIQQIEDLAHVTTLRIHSRMPVVLPSRMDQELLHFLANSRLKVVLVIHANHANELDDSVRDALQSCASAGITLLNQSVLLRRINDDAEVLVSLSKRLFELGVLPYYLHVLDPVSGAAHFDVDAQEAVRLHKKMSANLPGYLLPRLVRDVAGEVAKQAVYD